jgi:LCP family protein required for cell wall assembly
LGIDYTEPGSSLARTDSIVLATYSPLKPYVGLLSIPRDLWVNIPGYGENRINTAHFFAEAQSPGSGPRATIEMIEQDFNVDVDYFVRFKFDGFREIIDALGGLDLTLNKPAAGYEPGSYHLTGKKALAFVRSRYGSDDFFRMENGQIVLRAVLVQLLKPKSWIRYPSVLNAIRKSVTTNLPVFQWPRLVIALLRAGPDGIDNRTVSREMTTPYTTDQGASVLLPVWPVIHMVVQDMFK